MPEDEDVGAEAESLNKLAAEVSSIAIYCSNEEYGDSNCVFYVQLKQAEEYQYKAFEGEEDVLVDDGIVTSPLDPIDATVFFAQQVQGNISSHLSFGNVLLFLGSPQAANSFPWRWVYGHRTCTKRWRDLQPTDGQPGW